MTNHNDFEKLEIPLVATLVKIYWTAHQLIFSLPKFERYTLGEKIEKAILDAIELVIIANGTNKFEKEKYYYEPMLKLNC